MNPLIFAFWGTSFKKWVTSTCATLVTVATAVTMVIVPAWSALDLPVPAFKKDLRPILLTQSQQNVSIDQILLLELYRQLNDAQKDPAAGTSPIVQQRIRDIQAEITKTQDRINRYGASAAGFPSN
jgi:hypothetical protein